MEGGEKGERASYRQLERDKGERGDRKKVSERETERQTETDEPNERASERARERERERERERQRQRQRDRETERQRETEIWYIYPITVENHSLFIQSPMLFPSSVFLGRSVSSIALLQEKKEWETKMQGARDRYTKRDLEGDSGAERANEGASETGKRKERQTQAETGNRTNKNRERELELELENFIFQGL